MSPLLVYYCVLVLAASVLGGMAPSVLKLTHRWMEFAVSFVAGVMLGVALLHLLPDALLEARASGSGELAALQWVLVGFLVMFFVERFFCFHHHDVPEAAGDKEHHHHTEGLGCHEHDHVHSDHAHDLTWSGVTLGLVLHSVMSGVALAASVYHNPTGEWPAGVGTFLVIVLHKPFDAMTISMLMAKGGWSPAARNLVNAFFSLCIPVGAGLFYLGALTAHGANGPAIGYALAFSAGMFLCVSMSDLLPELQFHHHDRWKLSLALLLGLGVAHLASRFEKHQDVKPVGAASQRDARGAGERFSFKGNVQLTAPWIALQSG